MLDIKPITLLGGHHPTTARTGSGCFMDVIAYLNGDAQITDRSPCVDPVVRQLMISINDSLDVYTRQRLIPFVQRAMGTAGSDQRTQETRLVVMRDAVRSMMDVIPGVTQFKHSMYEMRIESCLIAARGHLERGDTQACSITIGAALGVILGTVYYMSKADGCVGVSTLGLRSYHVPVYPAFRADLTDVEAYSYRTVSVGELMLDILLKHIDLMLPPANEASAEVIKRAEDLVAVHNAHAARRTATV